MCTVIIFFCYEKLPYIMQLEPVRLSSFMQRPGKTVRSFGLQRRKAFLKARLLEFCCRITFDRSLRPQRNLPLPHLWHLRAKAFPLSRLGSAHWYCDCPPAAELGCPPPWEAPVCSESPKKALWCLIVWPPMIIPFWLFGVTIWSELCCWTSYSFTNHNLKFS